MGNFLIKVPQDTNPYSVNNTNDNIFGTKYILANFYQKQIPYCHQTQQDQVGE